jgi:hypothetical protein
VTRLRPRVTVLSLFCVAQLLCSSLSHCIYNLLCIYISFENSLIHLVTPTCLEDEITINKK